MKLGIKYLETPMSVVTHYQHVADDRPTCSLTQLSATEM